jgi:hypothetical protein
MDEEIATIERIIKNMDDRYIENKPKIMSIFRKDMEPIELSYKTLSGLKYNAENKFFFNFNDDLRYIKAYIIRWDKYVEVHDHPNSGCVFKILHGKLRSLLYHKNLRYKDTTYYSKGVIDYIDNDIGYHDMENLIMGDYSYSIHVYDKFYKPNYFNTVI